MLARRALLALPFLPAIARAQPSYPDHAVTIVNPWPAGGSSDSVTRILAQRLSVELGQPVVVENRPGATGTLGQAYVARARPDGYTLLLGTNSTYGIAPHLVPNIPYDSERAFTGISLIAKSPQILCVHPSVPARNLAELLALARAQPDKLSFATSGVGGTSHMATEMLLAMGGISMLHVPYRGGGPAAQALLAGEVQVTFVDAITALPFIAAGQVRALGVSTKQRTPLAPDVPTLAESGLPEFESSTDFAFMAVAGTPDAVVRRLYAATTAALANAELRSKLEAAGLLVLGEPPEAFEAYARAEAAKWGRIIRERNIRAP
ncbi:Bug family tripartite tricarboxylate transporter substrate binding protein [Siccirubricoccus phaeus]|uniref:Bug family tripartite tricarboxylate transporter substrate binding protein n=1 Tax=Siccirubricoccus phaeus TaxID=2595053 RepID=UPI001F3DD934|nr:tripartite tricarboxylate transporter substrate binding protein [Siccirubricoccus phaeus]